MTSPSVQGQGQTNLAALEQHYAQMQTTLSTMKASGAYSADQIQRYEQSTQFIGQQITNLTSILAALQAHSPQLPPPNGAWVNDASQMVSLKKNLWMEPSALIALMRTMMEIMNQQAKYGLIEGQNVATGMIKQEQMAQMQAKTEREIGQVEFRKNMMQAGTEAFQAAVNLGGAAQRMSASNNPKVKELDARTEQNKTAIAQKTAENTRLQAQLDRGTEPAPPTVGDQQQAQQPHEVPISDARRTQKEAQIAANKTEINRLEEDNVKVEAQRNDIIRQDLVTQEQITRGLEHAGAAVSKATEGVSELEKKNLEALLTLLRSYMDITKQSGSSAEKAKESARQVVQEMARALDSIFQTRTSTFWSRRS